MTNPESRIIKFPRKMRPATQEDIPFISDSFIKGSTCKIIEQYSDIDKVMVTFQQRCLLDFLVRRCEVCIAHNPDDESHIYGYMLWSYYEPQKTLLFHWAFVKSLFRKDGILGEMANYARDLSGVIDAAYVSFCVNSKFNHNIQRRFGIRCHTGSLNWINTR